MRPRPAGPTALLIVALMTLVPMGNAGADDGSQPRIRIEKMRHDFGDVFETDFYTHTYEVKNIGEADLVIDRVKPGCGCTAVEFDSIIPPGGVGKITLEVDNEKVTGHFDKAASIHSNDPEHPQMSISIAGSIIPYVEIQPGGRVYLRGMYGETISKEFTVFSNEKDNTDFAVTGVSSNMDDKVTYSFEPSGEPGRYTVKLFKNPKLPTMNVWGNVYIDTNSKNAPQKILQVNVTTRGAIVVQPSTVNFGELQASGDADETVEREVTVFKLSDEFEIKDVVFSTDQYEADVEPLEAGKKYKVTVRFHPGSNAQNHFDEMIIMTDDPREPSLRVRLVGRVI